MSAQPHSKRGRRTPNKRSSANGSANFFYLVLAAVVVIGVVIVGASFSSSSPTTTPATGSAQNIQLDPATLASYPSKGSADAPVTVVEFADYQCPGCAYFATAPEMEKALTEKYIDTGKVRLIYHELPISSHANAVPAAEAARAAGEQNKYWEMHDLLFQRQSSWAGLDEAKAKAAFVGYAAELGLDTAQFEQALNTGKYRPAVEAAGEQAARLGIPSTPSFVINGKLYSMNNLNTGIEQALAGN
jgi:protein-disulfide isomerase